MFAVFRSMLLRFVALDLYAIDFYRFNYQMAADHGLDAAQAFHLHSNLELQGARSPGLRWRKSPDSRIPPLTAPCSA